MFRVIMRGLICSDLRKSCDCHKTAIRICSQWGNSPRRRLHAEPFPANKLDGFLKGRSRLQSVLHQLSGTIDGASYGLDSAGNRTSKTDYQAGMTSNYAYDAIYEPGLACSRRLASSKHQARPRTIKLRVRWSPPASQLSLVLA